jgi:hypothetical protein
MEEMLCISWKDTWKGSKGGNGSERTHTQRKTNEETQTASQEDYD